MSVKLSRWWIPGLVLTLSLGTAWASESGRGSFGGSEEEGDCENGGGGGSAAPPVITCHDSSQVGSGVGGNAQCIHYNSGNGGTYDLTQLIDCTVDELNATTTDPDFVAGSDIDEVGPSFDFTFSGVPGSALVPLCFREVIPVLETVHLELPDTPDLVAKIALLDETELGVVGSILVTLNDEQIVMHREQFNLEPINAELAGAIAEAGFDVVLGSTHIIVEREHFPGKYPDNSVRIVTFESQMSSVIVGEVALESKFSAYTGDTACDIEPDPNY